LSEPEKEVIGIRGLNPDLYNQVLVKAKEGGKNVSELINDALRRYLDEVLGTSVNAPVIFGEGITSLVVSKDDLEKLGKAIIRGATSIKFAEDVDDKAIEEHVVAIENCTSVSIPHLAYISAMKRARNCTVVKSYGDRPSTVSRIPQSTGNEEVVRIGDLEELELSKEDLETFGKRVVLEDIEHLKFGPDFDVDTVNKYIETIREVETLEVPRSIYMFVLTKQRGCDTITKY